jgi:putative hydrolase of the HAD superfamily
MYKNLIFDLDGTLCECAKYYLEQQSLHAEFQSARTGLPKEFCFNLQRKIDVEFTPLPEGFTRNRFPRSFSAVSLTLDAMLGNEIDMDAAKRGFEFGDAVFEAPYELFAGVMDVLKEYKNAGFNMFLYSKGDTDVQLRKIGINDLYEIFDRKNTYIVGQKHPESLQKILDDHNLIKEETLVIGDSIRDEIGCAAQLSVPSAWVTGDSQVGSWEYENKKHPYTYEIHSVADLPSIVPIHSLVSP